MKSLRRILSRSVLGCLVGGLALLGCGEGGGGARFLSIGTGGTGGVYYPLGGGLAAQLTQRDSTSQYTAEVTGGSVENVNRVLAGQIDLAFSVAVTLFEAHNGLGDYEQANPDLRIVAPLYPNLIQIVVGRGVEISSFDEIRGMRVSVGPAGSGTEQTARQLLEIHGMTYDDVDEKFLSFNESSAGLRDGALDVAIVSVGYPASAVLEATTSGGARLLGLESTRIDQLVQAYPYYQEGVVPTGIYPGLEEPVATVEMNNWIVARADLSAEVVDALLNVISEDRVSLERIHEMAAYIDLDALASAPIALHPAVETFLANR